jgi:hypothetical protein
MATITDRKAGAMHTIDWYELDWMGSEGERFAIVDTFAVYERFIAPPDAPDAPKANWHTRYNVSEFIAGDEVIVAEGILHDEVMRIIRREQEQRAPHANLATLIHSDDFATIAMTPDQLEMLETILDIVREDYGDEDRRKVVAFADALYRDIRREREPAA